jgi:tetrahydromethanopterin S-methyltransferase subunit G
MENEDFYKNEYFKQLDKRLDDIEDKIDKLNAKVTWIYASASVLSGIVAFVINALFLWKK